MNLNNLNQWLTLTANVGVFVGLIVLIFELQQTQTSMLAESSTTRAQMTSENASIAADNHIVEMQVKSANGEELSQEELRGSREFLDRLLRHFENLHYQNKIGVLDEETWETNARSMRNLRHSPLFESVYPGWPNDIVASRYRDSYVEFLEIENP